MKFLIDECLSAELTKAAITRGYAESSHVVWLGKAGAKDWDLMRLVIDGDWTFVTRNAYDFRGPPSTPGSRGGYAKIELHAGLICLDGPSDGFDLDQQLELFEIVMDQLDGEPDLVNQVLEVVLESNSSGEVVVRRYDLPRD